MSRLMYKQKNVIQVFALRTRAEVIGGIRLFSEWRQMLAYVKKTLIVTLEPIRNGHAILFNWPLLIVTTENYGTTV